MEIGVGDFVVVETLINERKIGQPRNQLGQIHAIRDDGSKGVMLRIPGKSRTLSRGHPQKLHIEEPQGQREVTIEWDETRTEATVTTANDIDTSTPQALIQFQESEQQRKLEEEQAAVRASRDQLRKVEQGLTIKDIVKEARAQGDQSIEGEATEYVDPESMQYSPDYFAEPEQLEEDSIDEEDEKVVAFFAEHNEGPQHLQAEAFWTAW